MGGIHSWQQGMGTMRPEVGEWGEWQGEKGDGYKNGPLIQRTAPD